MAGFLRIYAVLILVPAFLYSFSLLILETVPNSFQLPMNPSFPGIFSKLHALYQDESKVHDYHSLLPSTLSFNYTNQSSVDQPRPFHYSAKTLGIAASIYVVSLPRRIDRRADLEVLLNSFGLRWTWWDATSSQDALVADIMERVRWERAVHAIQVHWGFSPHYNVLQPTLKGINDTEQPYHRFRTVEEVEIEDPIGWNVDAVPNLNVYPPLIEASSTTDPSANESSSRLLAASPRGHNDSSLPFELAGSELWLLDPVSDMRSTRRTNPIPVPPAPDVRFPLPCAPLPLDFDMSTRNSPEFDAKLADILHARDVEEDEDVEDDPRMSAKLRSRHREDVVDDDMEDSVQEGKSDKSTLKYQDELRQLPEHYSPYPFHLTLSRGMIACWNSHFRLLRHIANGADEAAIILEDDVDMEFNAYEVLTDIWDALPLDWDIVFLGMYSAFGKFVFLFSHKYTPFVVMVDHMV